MGKELTYSEKRRQDKMIDWIIVLTLPVIYTIAFIAIIIKNNKQFKADIKKAKMDFQEVEKLLNEVCELQDKLNQMRYFYKWN
jgi:hypothetical protein